MSILIKNMEMPTSCDDCPMGGNLCCHLLPGVPALWAEYTNAVREKRMHSDCPLVPVPDHGRLIDADALDKAIGEEVHECAWDNAAFSGYRVWDLLDDAPTIIPAEEGET